MKDASMLFAQRLKRREFSYGAVVGLSDPAISECAADCGMDFVWLDGEHAPLTIEHIHHHILALRGTDCAALVRVPANDPNVIKPVLDLAPAGVIVPMVCSAAEARRVVEACKYPPVGIRGCGVRRATGYGAMPWEEYMERSARLPLVIIQVEHVRAIENLDEIMAVPGIDSICIGPCDLSGSMGILNQMSDPGLNRLIDETAARINAAGIPFGTAAGDLPRWKERGVTWFTGTADWGAMASGFRAAVKEAKR